MEEEAHEAPQAEAPQDEAAVQVGGRPGGGRGAGAARGWSRGSEGVGLEGRSPRTWFAVAAVPARIQRHGLGTRDTVLLTSLATRFRPVYGAGEVGLARVSLL